MLETTLLGKTNDHQLLNRPIYLHLTFCSKAGQGSPIKTRTTEKP